MQVAGAFALVAVMLMVVGPAVSHHYAESSPYHSHVFLNGTLAEHHSHINEGHNHDAHGADVLNTIGHSAAGYGPVHIDIHGSTSTVPRLVSNVQPAPCESNTPQAFPGPPEQPPRFS